MRPHSAMGVNVLDDTDPRPGELTPHRHPQSPHDEGNGEEPRCRALALLPVLDARRAGASPVRD